MYIFYVQIKMLLRIIFKYQLVFTGIKMLPVWNPDVKLLSSSLTVVT